MSVQKETKELKKEFVPEDLKNLPEGTQAEVINGKMYLLAAPSTDHQRLVGFFFLEIANYIRSHNGTCEVFPAPFDVFLETKKENGEQKNHVVQPDLLVICDPDKITDHGCKGAPDLVIEITSPSTAGRDYLQKMNLYREAGVREYWIVDPDMETVGVYFFDRGYAPMEYTFTDYIPVNICDDLSVQIKEPDDES